VSADGTVTGVAIGQTSVTVTAVADPNVRVIVPVNIIGGVTSVSLTPDRDTLRPTQTRQLTLTVVTQPGVSQSVALTSANPSVATIDGNARVTAVGVGQAFVRAISLVDPSVADSTLIVVVDPCAFLTPLPIGTTVNGAITATSCSGKQEFYSYTVNTQTALALSINHSFPASFIFFADNTGGYFFTNNTAPASGTGTALVAPGKYVASVLATNATQVGTYSIVASVNPTHSTLCATAATTGITVTLPLNTCNFQPATRPAGTYRSYAMSLLPYIRDGQRVTITVTATGFTPLIEVRMGSFPPITAIAQPGENTAIQSFLGQGEGGFVTFFVSSVNAGQTGTFTVKVEGPPSTSPLDLGAALRTLQRAQPFR
jgi:hypothetical protein